MDWVSWLLDFLTPQRIIAVSLKWTLVLFVAGGLLLPFFGLQFRQFDLLGETAPLLCLAFLLAGAALALRDWRAGDSDPEEIEREIEQSRSVRVIGEQHIK